ncbi:rhomboid family intramembrane serine protease [Polyangium sp. 15x6]|uniref:rhomboid family intramembrane serine protease n=1 Tax=Polyangium sp. 15x6 TaxID=3042687 RepID=UPI00249BAFF7|nr:rhomboid family intramembrane serine protease [Polyangium sp. 15x6]MDI3285808.1 rhomboid family intramembrane serine protease [Polyangium sp. 15x6]
MNDLPARLLASPVPVLLIASVAIVSLLGWVSEPVRRALILVPYQVRKNGHIHRLLTAGWVHADFSHLAFNMFSLYFFTEQTIRVLGVTRYLVLYVTAVIVGFIPTTLRYMRKPNYSSLGASGAVAAVMFSAVLLVPKLKLQLMFLPIPVPGIVFAVAYLAYSAWHSYTAGDDINHDAHFSGAVYGALLTYLFEPTRVERTLKNFF